MGRTIYLPILGIGAVFGGVVFFSYRADLGALGERYQAESHEHSAAVAQRVEEAFQEVYRGLRTIARLPAVRAASTDRFRAALDGGRSRLEDDVRQTVQEIYNGLVENAPLSTAYVVPVDLEPDPLTGDFQGPIATFDRIVVDDSSVAGHVFPVGRAEGTEGSDTAELAGYFLIKKQLERMLDTVPVAENVKGLDHPADLACPDEADGGRPGLIYSVPSYAPDGSLGGCISAVILTDALRKLLGEGDYAISNGNGKFLIEPDMETVSEETREWMTRAEPDPELLYSEVIPLEIVDQAGQWNLWVAQPDALFWERPEVRRAGRGANLGYLGALVLVSGLATVTFLTGRSRQELEEKNLELEQWIERRSADLRSARDTAQAANHAKVRREKEAIARQAEEEPPAAEKPEEEPPATEEPEERHREPVKTAEKPPTESEAQRQDPAAKTESTGPVDADRRWLWQREHTIPSKSEAGQVVIEEVLKKLEEQGWPRRDVFGVHLAVGEAMTNAIKHGNGQDPARKIQVASSLAADLLRIRITDEGSGFDPAILPDPTAPENLEATTGRGVMVMRNYMSRVEFLEPGNTVVMEKDHDETV